MNLLSNAENLLEKVRLISEKHEEIERITGESYNIFSLLNLSSKEVGLHSIFISDLLNPNGTHSFGSIFLDHFINQQIKKCKQGENIKKLSSFNSKNCVVISEQYLGIINYEYTEGGYIDIILRDNNRNQIIIENKVYAGDQKISLLDITHMIRKLQYST